VSDAALDPEQGFRVALDADVDDFVAASLDGYHELAKPITLSFFVREPEARWVARNLLPGMKPEDERDGIRVTVRTSALAVVARYVTQLGAAAEPETPALAERVAEIARGALRISPSTPQGRVPCRSLSLRTSRTPSASNVRDSSKGSGKRS